jgi:hypothetical protein
MKELQVDDTFRKTKSQLIDTLDTASSITTRLLDDMGSLSSTFPVSLLSAKQGYVEQYTLRVDDFGIPQGLSYSLKKAIGAPLFTHALVDVQGPMTATGPFISETDKKPSTSAKEEPAPEESQSFLRKYWWIIVGFFLLSSMFGQSQDQSADNTRGTSS